MGGHSGKSAQNRAAALCLTSNFSALLKENWCRVSGTGASNQDPGHPAPILLLRKSDLKLVTLGRLAFPLPYPIGVRILPSVSATTIPLPPPSGSFPLPLDSPKTAQFSWMPSLPMPGTILGKEVDPDPGQNGMKSACATGVGRREPKPPLLQRLGDWLFTAGSQH